MKDKTVDMKGSKRMVTNTTTLNTIGLDIFLRVPTGASLKGVPGKVIVDEKGRICTTSNHYFILHTLFHPIIIILSQHMSIPS